MAKKTEDTKDLVAASEAAYNEALTATSPAIASPAQNAELTHADPSAPETTRDDYTDAGVPMLPGSPTERQGPEDALGIGPKRGDYTSRVGPGDYNPHVSVLDPVSGRTKLVPQRALAEQIGDVPGVKGGVDTSPAALPGYTNPGASTPEFVAAQREMMNRESGLNPDGSAVEASTATTSPATASSTAPTGTSTPTPTNTANAPVRGRANTPEQPEPGSGVEELTHEKDV